jgi:uncharacterized protein (TIGR02466 family)
MFGATDVIQLFPSCVWLHEVTDSDELNNNLRRAVDDIRASGAGWDRTDGGGWTSPTDLMNREPFQPLVDLMAAAAEGALHFLSYAYDNFYISESWANLNHAGDIHPQHLHPNAVLSGVYYVSAPEKCGDIIFHDPRRQALVIHPKLKENTDYNSDRHALPPFEGLLAMFPSWLEHSVEANMSGSDRLSISFNIMLTGEIGHPTGRIVI